MEDRLEVGRVPLDVAELGRFPAGLLVVVGRVEREAVRVQVGVGQPVHRPRREVRELAPGEVACDAILVASFGAHAGLGFRLDVLHRGPDRVAEGVEHAVIPRQAIEQRNALGRVEVQVVADAAIGLAADRERLARVGAEVVAEAVPVVVLDSAGQPEHRGSLAPPEADELLALGVVVRSAVVRLRSAAVVVLSDAQHPFTLTHKPCHPVNTHPQRRAHAPRSHGYAGLGKRLRCGCRYLAAVCNSVVTRLRWSVTPPRVPPTAR